jgi:glycerol-3-phosphate dehydrogenase
MPWGDFHYIGPVDSPAEPVEIEFRATNAEIEQILANANQLLPELHLGRNDVIYSWAGVRPRTASKGETLGSLEVREHDLSDRGLPNFIVFTGGLIMTHRDAGRRLLRAIRRYVSPSGSARPVDYHLTRQPDEDRVSAQSVRRACKEEQARTLSDILRRRVSVGWQPDLGLGDADAASRLAAEILGWSEEERQAQLLAYRAEVEQNFRPRSAVTSEEAMTTEFIR